MVREFQRGRTRAALFAVDHDEIGGDARFQHGADDAHKFAAVPDAELKAHRFAARQITQLRDEAHHFDRGAKGRMAGRRHAIDAHRNVAGLCDFGGDFRGRQHAALTGFGTLAELNLDHLDLIRGGRFRELFGGKLAFVVATAKIARADFINQVAAAFAVVTADPAFACVMGKATHARAIVQRQDRIGRQRAKAHGRDVVDREVIGLRAIGAADGHAEILILDFDRTDRVGEPLIAALIDALFRAKGAFILNVFGALVDDGASIAGKRHLFVVSLKKVLTNFRADHFKEIPHPTEQREVPQNRVFRLDRIQEAQQRQNAQDDRDNRREDVVLRQQEREQKGNRDPEKRSVSQ